MIRRYVHDVFVEAPRILFSRRFWRAVRDYYRPRAVAARLDALAARLRDQR